MVKESPENPEVMVKTTNTTAVKENTREVKDPITMVLDTVVTDPIREIKMVNMPTKTKTPVTDKMMAGTSSPRDPRKMKVVISPEPEKVATIITITTTPMEPTKREVMVKRDPTTLVTKDPTTRTDPNKVNKVKTNNNTFARISLPLKPLNNLPKTE